MPRKVQDVDVLTDYLRGVLDRAEHHAGNVDVVALTIAGAVLWRKDSDPLRVYEREGRMGNVLWVKIGGQQVCPILQP